MRSQRVRYGGAIAIGSLVLAASVAQPDSGGTTHVVVIENLQFHPQTLKVHRGERVIWVNKDFFPHTVTASSRAFDSKSIAASASWTYVVTAKPGEYPYRCTFHPNMTGTLDVD